MRRVPGRPRGLSARKWCTRCDCPDPAGRTLYMIRYLARPATAEPVEHAEGPMWDARTNQLVFVDQYDGGVHVADYDAPAGSLTTDRVYDLGAAVGAVVPVREPGAGWLVAWAQGFGHLAADGTLTVLDQPEPRSNRMNDGK